MADLIMFPQEHNLGKARHVAATWIAVRTTRARHSYWRTIATRLATTMRNWGVPEEEIEVQIEALRSAVQEQIYLIEARTRQHASRHQNDYTDNGPGAA
jgi:hypothetical protein